jgi:methionyl-tRNA synthetase
MPERIFVGVAWPYANGPIHVGAVTGAYLPADIFARYHRLVGNDVLMVSGTDEHGTPITVRAEAEGITPRAVADKYFRLALDNLTQLGISYDLFTRTTTPNHERVVQDMFLKLYQRGFIEKRTTQAAYCPNDRRFLPDRYIEGTCPRCGYTSARGDQCDNDGKPLDPVDLIDPHCKLCGTTPVMRPTEHFFLRLSAFEQQLRDWLEGKTFWKPHVLGESVGFLREGLQDRAITRDIEWGVPIPLPGYPDKRIYVWFDAFIGYWSASIEWASLRNTLDAWKPYWLDEATRAYYFLGRDNIFFHTIMWPMVLMAYGELNLPYDVPANAYMNDESGSKMSKSRGIGMLLPDYLARYDPDAIRYLFTAIMPEMRDSNFAPDELIRRNNDELVATYGNFVNRTLTFIWRYFDGVIPELGVSCEADTSALSAVSMAFVEAGTAFANCQFKEALRIVFGLAALGNRYFDDQAPWRQIKVDRVRCATTLHVCLQLIGALRTLTWPILPFSSQRLHTMLGVAGDVRDFGWRLTPVIAGQRIREPVVLFKKLDDNDAQTHSLGGAP